jgi:prepilin signal peptidase PulO-like enzyme (type II secretory pathway)
MFILYIVTGIIGIFAGGIVNALADDLPHYRRGITAFLLGKRSSAGGAKLSWRYPLTEIATAALMILTLAVKNDEGSANSIQIMFWLAYMAIFVLITVIDLEHKLILFAVIIPASILAIIDSIITPRLNNEPDLQRALIGGAIGFGVCLLIHRQHGATA